MLYSKKLRGMSGFEKKWINRISVKKQKSSHFFASTFQKDKKQRAFSWPCLINKVFNKFYEKSTFIKTYHKLWQPDSFQLVTGKGRTLCQP